MGRDTTKLILVFLVGLLLMFALIGCGGSEEATEVQTLPGGPNATTPKPAATTPAPPQTTPPAPASASTFETVGMFDNSPAMVAISYFVTNPIKAEITAQCDEMKARFIDGGVTTNLRISFFDDRALTPDYAGGYDIPEASQAAEVANYYFNADNNNATRLLFLKGIP